MAQLNFSGDVEFFGGDPRMVCIIILENNYLMERPLKITLSFQWQRQVFDLHKRAPFFDTKIFIV